VTGTKEGNIPTQPKSKEQLRNRVLARLSAQEFALIEPDLEPVSLAFGQIVYEFQSPIEHVYFPESGVLSMIGVAGDDSLIEVGLLGRDGLSGLPIFLGVSESSNQVIVQNEGTALRMKSRSAKEHFARAGSFHDEILLFTHDLFLQVSQTTSCNRHHEVQERLARWLLMMRDRVASNTLQLTQEFLSWMLGVRNQAVSRAAKRLQGDGSIRYSRGTLEIINHQRLELTACVCYRMMKARMNNQFS
jgi:CRP-like cAMP-binding protein